jgi:hypothetical protein
VGTLLGLYVRAATGGAVGGVPLGRGVGVTEDGIGVGSADGSALGLVVRLLDGLTVGLRVGQVQSEGFVLGFEKSDADG